MILSKEHTALFVLLRAGLWEREIDRLDLFPLSFDSWMQVFALARRQSVLGIVWRGLELLPEHLLPSEALMIRWVAETDRIERLNKQADKTVESIFRMFRDAGLHPVLMKGQGVAQMYSRPQLREPGDIDLYFPTAAECRQAEQLILNQDIAFDRNPDGSISYRWQGIEVEHHRRLIDIHNPFRRKAVNSLEQSEGFTEITLSAQSDTSISIPSPRLNLLLLNAHILKHALGRGIGLRQCCDMARGIAVAQQSHGTEEMAQIYRRTGISRWSDMLCGFLASELGLADIHAGKHANYDSLLEIILRGGNFGRYDTRYDARFGWRRKLQTARAFAENMCFSLRYAPAEAFWAVAQLMKGQMKC